MNKYLRETICQVCWFVLFSKMVCSTTFRREVQTDNAVQDYRVNICLCSTCVKYWGLGVSLM